MRRQGHGHIAVLSSVAGERARAGNFVYGSSKAGLDAFAQGLGDSLAGSGVKVTVIRPGFVHSRMTRGLKSAPFATTPRVVGELAVAGMRKGKHTVWTPGILRYVFMHPASRPATDLPPVAARLSGAGDRNSVGRVRVDPAAADAGCTAGDVLRVETAAADAALEQQHEVGLVATDQAMVVGDRLVVFG